MANHASDIANMTSDSTTSNTTDPIKDSRIGTPEQPRSRLHRLSLEPREIIWEFAVISPDYIPSRITIRDIKVTKPRTAEEGRPTTTGGNTSKTTIQQHQILPTQPPLACTDRATRAEVLRIFYQRNTFLFRVTPLIPNPLRIWLAITGLEGSSTDGKQYATGAAKLVERVAIECSVRKSCVQHVEDRSAPPQHTYRIVVGLEKLQAQRQKAPALHCEADLALMCACTLRAAASLKSPKALFSIADLGMRTETGMRMRMRAPQTAAEEIVSLACEVEVLGFYGSDQDCKFGGLCDGDRMRGCKGCGKLVLMGNFGENRVGEYCGLCYEHSGEWEGEFLA